MKTKFLQFALVAFAALTFTSCSNDDNNNKAQEPNTVTINGKTKSFTDLEPHIYDGYIIFPASTEMSEYKVGDIYEHFVFEIPLDRVGEKVRLEKNDNGNPYYRIEFYEWFSYDGEIEDEEIAEYSNKYDTQSFTGTNNWVQFTKNSELENTYTVEFEMNAEGKVIKGNYTGEFPTYSW